MDELGARSVLDIGCGTGSFACLLAQRGLHVVGLDPAAASLEVARTKPGADRVRWIHGDTTSMPPLQVDVAAMTGNIAQVFVTDDDWMMTLRAISQELKPGGWLVFESRMPKDRAWRRWTPRESHTRADIKDVGVVDSWVEVTDVQGPLVSFRSTFMFESPTPRARSCRRRSRDTDSAADPPAHGVFDGAGLLLQPSDARRRAREVARHAGR